MRYKLSSEHLTESINSASCQNNNIYSIILNYEIENFVKTSKMIFYHIFLNKKTIQKIKKVSRMSSLFLHIILS